MFLEYIFTFFLFVFPLLIISIKLQLFKDFVFSKVVKTVNFSLIIQVFLWILLASSLQLQLDVGLYYFLGGVFYAYTVLGMFYLLAILVLNLVSKLK